MPDLPQIIPNNSPESLWAKKVNEGINQTQVIESPDFIRAGSGQGAALTLKLKHKFVSDSPRFANDIDPEFDPDSGYDYYEEIQVMPGTIYTDKDGNDVDVDPGVWRCVKPVPPNSDYWQSVPSIYQDRYKRTPGVNYYPKWSGGEQTEYWKLIGMLPCG